MSKKPAVLIIDDEKNIREGLRQHLKMEGFEVYAAEDGEDGYNKFTNLLPDAVILDLKMPKMGGIEFLKKTSDIRNNIPVFILTGHGAIDEAVETMKLGAYDFLTKPPNIEKLIILLRRAIEENDKNNRRLELEKIVNDRFNFENIIGNSKAIRDIIDIVKQVAPTKASVLITGESGTGKEVIANAIHFNSPRKNNPYLKIHCAAIPENLLESELFGFEKGAFTGAIARKKGLFELADKGTIFLDEIGEISPNMQVKLLRVLQDQEFQRLGSEEVIKVDVRIIAATNRNLKKMVSEGLFREDLFYRLNIINIYIPPLRERKEDIPLLVNHFIKNFELKHNKKDIKITPKALKILESNNWKGNVRELQNVIESMIVLSKNNIIDEENIPDEYKNVETENYINIPLGISLEEAEKRIILANLNYFNNNHSKTARYLKIGRKTLLRKLDMYGVRK